MDIVFIRQLKVETVIGVHDWERRIRQTVVLDLELGWDTTAGEDDLERALDYSKVAERVRTFVEDSRFQLVETLAERLAALLLGEFQLPWLKLTLAKPGAVRGAREVGVIIERGQRD
ncbi:MAG: dihydroneopterin aldolase [Candidatus Competibacteraceae bacterium]|nr:dihydroneopterin aldolase [Candidatus Competibacteraceae bacterium]